MATEPVPPVPAPVPPLPDRTCWPARPVQPVDWFLRMPNGGGTVYLKPAD